MRNQADSFPAVLESRYPGLIAEVRGIIEESERRYQRGSAGTESFLWEHTTHVAALAVRLAVAEGCDPLIPAIAALFHDAGKFAHGEYHQDEMPEEEESARIAGKVLRTFGVKEAAAKRVGAGLDALYRENARRNKVAGIVHDADFLAKFGALGVANFFLKSALRGRTLGSAVIGHLSKELTYAACLPLNMHTAAGRRQAARKAAASLRFFRSLLAELRASGIADLRVREIQIPFPGRKRGSVEVCWIGYSACARCGGGWHTEWMTENGIKCRRLRLESTCSRCGDRIETSFCLPELASGRQRPARP